MAPRIWHRSDARQRRDGETMASAFQRIYEDRANASLAQAERNESRIAIGAGVRVVG
jgi:hypothetical protein